MPLQTINVSPIEWKTEEFGAYSLQQVPGRYQTHGDLRMSTKRCDSQSSSLSSTNYDICRICHCEGDVEVPLIAPCYCAGSLRYVHQTCLQQWIKSSNIRCCELCKFQFIMQTKTKPFSEWEQLDMSGFERRKLLCAVMFHAVAITCVGWSLYVLILRTFEEMQTGLLEWPFWTKLIVVAIGLTGGAVFMYIQCKAYFQICQRWKAFNRVIYVQNAPEKPTLPSTISSAAEINQANVYTSTLAQPGPGLFLFDAYNEPVAIHPSSSENQLKPYQDGSRGTNNEETSIDLKGVRNLHIFFNDENGIRVQKNNVQSCSVDIENDAGEGCSQQTSNQRSENDSHSTSLHIKFGKNKEPNGKGNDVTMSNTHRAIEENYGRTLNPPDIGETPVKSNSDKMAAVKCGELANGMNESPVLQLQIKKAEIVIKFGQKSSGTDLTALDDKQNEDISDPIVIDLVQNTYDQTKTANEQSDSQNPVQIRVDFRKESEGKQVSGLEECKSPTINEAPLGRTVTWVESDNVPGSEPGSGSQSPLLATPSRSD